MAKTATATHEIAFGIERNGSRASSARFDTVSMPVYAIIATGIASAKLDHVGAVPKWMFVDEDVRREDEEEADRDEQELRREVEHREQDVELRRLLDADDVQADEQPREGDADDHVPRRRAQRLPEDREVVRHEDHRDRDGDHVVEHLRPRGSERDELVERVPRERRGAAGLGVAHRSLGVRRGRRGEDEAADDEDERRQAERDARRQAERVVDRRADVAVGGRKEGVRPENAFELVGLPAPPGHARTLVTAADRYRRSWYGTAARITFGSKSSSRFT